MYSLLLDWTDALLHSQLYVSNCTLQSEDKSSHSFLQFYSKPLAMAPIRVALVGLSASAKVNWAAEAHLPYLNSARGKQHYELVALLDSSVKAAESAKMTFGLSSKIKAYGHPEKLAADPDVDLVVVKTRADVHFPVVEPSIRGGKGVFVEWPLVESLEKGIELEEVSRIPTASSVSKAAYLL